MNPLEMHENIVDYNNSLKTKLFCPLPERVEVFDCSCCPPNVTRFIESIGNYIYGIQDGTVFVNQYISSETEIAGTRIRIESAMPYDGKVTVRVKGKANLALRVPSWNGGIVMSVDGKEEKPCVCDDYIRVSCEGEIVIALDFQMKARFVYANENVWYDNGRKAVEYGPMVLCGESVDNGKNLRSVRIASLDGANVKTGEDFVLEVPAEKMRTSDALYSYDPPYAEKFTLKLIPYFAWANRGKGDMQIWWL